jgi:hypothetical protein
MNNPLSRLLFTALLVLLLCGPVQATTSLQITVLDSIDNTTVPHATVFVNGANYALTNTNGQAFLTHSGNNNQVIMVTMSGYNDWSQTVANDTTVLLVNMSRTTLTFNVALYDSDTLGPISGAIVHMTAGNSSLVKQTDSSGSATFAVTANTRYALDITADNYQPRNTTINIATENQAVQYKLLSGNSFSFVVRDRDTGKAVSGEMVRLNNVLAGQTDDRGILITPVSRGKSYVIEVTKDGYQSSTETRTIGEADAIYTATLTKAPVGAFVYVIDESRKPLNGADVYINGTLSGTTNEYGRTKLSDLVTGDYLIEVRKSGYLTQSRATSLSGLSQDYSFTLPYENAALTITVEDKEKNGVPNATIALDGNPAGRTDENGQLLTHIAFNTDVNITVTKEGYQPLSARKQVISGNATSAITLTLDRSIDWGLIGMIIVGAVCVLILLSAIRRFGHRKRRHVVRRNEI